MNSLIPPKLRRGDTIRVIAPALSLAIISRETRAIADRRLRELGLEVTFGRHVEERDAFDSSSIEARVADLQSLLHQPGFAGVRGLVIGRFQRASGMTPDLLRAIIGSKRELDALPVIAGADFGHTDPMITLPIGGTARVTASGEQATLEFLIH